MRKLFSITIADRKVEVFFNNDWDEYVVKFYADGVYLQQHDYHADDRADAYGTANNFVNQPSPVIQHMAAFGGFPNSI